MVKFTAKVIIPLVYALSGTASGLIIEVRRLTEIARESALRESDSHSTPLGCVHAALFLAAAAIGILRVWQTGQLRFALAPVAVVPIWLILHLQTPRDGRQVTTIRSTPGAVVLLWFMAATLISMALLFALDIYVIGHPFRAPLEPYHAALFAPPFIIMFTGAFWADRIAKAKKTTDCTHDGEEDSA